MKYFTPESANPTLPLVRQIAEDMAGLQAELDVRGERISSIAAAPRLAMSAAHAEEFAEMRASLLADQCRMRQIKEELASIGARVHSPTLGAIDFPAMFEDREVRLCWLPGDEAVSHWHEVDEPPHARRAIGGERFGTAAGNRTDSDRDRGSERGPWRTLL